MTPREHDPLIRRLERSSLAVCLLAAALAVVARGGSPDVALGILGGGVLSAVSYWAIKSSVDGLLASLTLDEGAMEAKPAASGRGGSRRPGMRFALRFAARYALLGFAAYAMIARFRLHPVGMLIGVSSIFVAASLEAFRSPSRRPGAGRREPTGTSRTSTKA